MPAPDPPTRSRRGWWAAAGLILLSLIPAVQGSIRVAVLSTGPAVTPENARFVEMPLPVVLHILTVIPFSMLGALQFVATFRRHRPNWHRRVGRVLVVCGLVLAATGLWMSVFYDLPSTDGFALELIRVAVAVTMLVQLVLGFRAIRRKDVGSHRAWMIRAYALALGAGTQVLTHIPWGIAFGAPTELPRTLLMAVGWGINAVVAEWLIRRPARLKPGVPGKTPVSV